MGMENLISLDISKNLVREMKPGVLKNQYLNEVNMSRNFIKELDEAAFKDLSILEVTSIAEFHVSSILYFVFRRLAS
jgi:Leucine-rich repeat (LRR) protein